MRLGAAIYLAVAVSCITHGTISYGQSSALTEAYTQFTTLYQQGRFAEAVPYATETLKLGQEEFGPDHPTTATLLNNLAELHRAQSNYAEAAPLYERPLAVREKALGPEHPDVATLLENYATLLRKAGLSETAAELETRAKAIREKQNCTNTTNPNCTQYMAAPGPLFRWSPGQDRSDRDTRRNM